MHETILAEGLDTRPMFLEPMWRIMFQAPEEDVDRIFEAVTSVADLVHGKTDRNAFRSKSGVEYYRPLEGTPTGAEDEVRKRPGVDEIAFYLPRDAALLDRVIEAIYESHSYYEPVIVVQEALRSRCKGLDDSANPNRWWNRAGDWKTKADAG